MSEVVVVAILAAVSPTIFAAASMVASLKARSHLRKQDEKLEKIHIEVNDRLTQLLVKTEQMARAEGHAAGRAERGRGAKRKK